MSSNTPDLSSSVDSPVVYPTINPIPYAAPAFLSEEAMPLPRRPLQPIARLSKSAIFLLLLVYLLIVLYPVIWLFYTSLKPDQDIFLHPFQLPSPDNLRWDNFTRAWNQTDFGRHLLNSIALTASTVIVTTFIAASTAFALTRYSIRAATPLLMFFLAGLMIPLQLAIVPLFFQMKSMHLLNSLTGLFFAYIGFGLPFAVFVLAGFFKTLPKSLHESARLDGCNEWQSFWHVMLPLARPGLITVAIFLFLGNWNEFFVAFICLSGKGSEAARTLPLAISNITIVSQYRSDWGVAFAGLVMMMLPALIVYIALQKHLTKGITAGAVKG